MPGLAGAGPLRGRLWLAISEPARVHEAVFVQFDDVHLFADHNFGNGVQP